MKRFFLTIILSILLPTSNLLAFTRDNAVIIRSYIYYQSDLGNSINISLLCPSNNQTIVIDGKEYQRIDVYWQESISTKENVLSSQLFIRREDAKIFRYSEKAKRDILIMDYDLNVGDKFVSPDGKEMQVVSKEINKTLDNAWPNIIYSPVITLLNLNDNTSTETWVDGIGSLESGYLTNEALIEFGLPTMKQAYNLYTYDPSLISTDYNGSALLYNEQSFKSGIFFNTKQTYNDNIPNEELKVFFEGSDFIISGILYSNGLGAEYVTCSIDNNSIIIKRYPIGEEMDCIIAYHVYYVFKDFTAGTYSITVQGYDTNYNYNLECSPLSSVNNTNIYINRNQIFDLTGRRLNSVPEKGMYIKDGRKWLRK